MCFRAFIYQKAYLHYCLCVYTDTYKHIHIYIHIHVEYVLIMRHDDQGELIIFLWEKTLFQSVFLELFLTIIFIKVIKWKKC